MTEAEARAEAARRNREDPERTTHSWLPRKAADGAWAVARIGVPAHGPTVATTQAGEPAPRDDVRPVVPPNHMGF